MKKKYIFILPIILFVFGLIIPVKTFAVISGSSGNGQASLSVSPNPVPVGQWVTLSSTCANGAANNTADQVQPVNGNGVYPFDNTPGGEGAFNSLKNLNPPQGAVVIPGIRQPDNSCPIQGNYKAANQGTYIWYHGWSCSSDTSCAKVDTIQFTIGNGSPIPTAAVPTSTLPSVTPNKIPSITPLPTLAPLPNCYDKLGAISFKKEDSSFETFDVYSKSTGPQTFYLKSQSDPNTYVYTITDATYPSYNNRNSSLQLGNLPFITKNEWTWATPWCKPAIYLYPEKPTDIRVKLNLDGQMTMSSPVYDTVNGWSIKANPNGTIEQFNNLTMKQFPYLYYEADLNNVDIPKNGFVIPQMNLGSELSSILITLGFNNTERNDFLKYWLPRLTDRPYYFVTLLPENVINEKEAISISSLANHEQRITNNDSIIPDTMIRSRFVFEGLDTPIKVDPPLSVPSHKRLGFTLTDWGGTIVGKSCTDITVK